MSTLCFREVFVKMCLPAAVLSLRLCCVATEVAGWNRGCRFAERFQQIALFNCKEFDYSERSRFRTFRLFCWTKITYLLDEINIYYMDPVTFSTICLNMTRAYHLDRLDIYILLNEFYFCWTTWWIIRFRWTCCPVVNIFRAHCL